MTTTERIRRNLRSFRRAKYLSIKDVQNILMERYQYSYWFTALAALETKATIFNMDLLDKLCEIYEHPVSDLLLETPPGLDEKTKADLMMEEKPCKN